MSSRELPSAIDIALHENLTILRPRIVCACLLVVQSEESRERDGPISRVVEVYCLSR